MFGVQSTIGRMSGLQRCPTPPSDAAILGEIGFGSSSVALVHGHSFFSPKLKPKFPSLTAKLKNPNELHVAMAYFGELYLEGQGSLLSLSDVYLRTGRKGLMRAIRQARDVQAVERSLTSAIYRAVPLSDERSPIDVWVVGYDSWLHRASYVEGAGLLTRGDTSRHFRLVFIREPISGRLTLPVDDLSSEFRAIGLIMKAESQDQPFSRAALRAWRQLENYADRILRSRGSPQEPTISDILNLAGLPYVHFGDTPGGHALLS